MRRVNYFSSMLNYERKILILNNVIPPLQFQKLNSQKLYKTKILQESFEIYGQDRFWPFSVFCFKSFSGVLAFGILTGDIYRSKRTKLIPLGSFLLERLQNWYTFRK